MTAATAHNAVRHTPRPQSLRAARLAPIPGSPPSLINVPSGCVFHPRCAYKALVPDDKCRTDPPELLEAEGGHTVRCHIPPGERKRLWLEEVRPKL